MYDDTEKAPGSVVEAETVDRFSTVTAFAWDDSDEARIRRKLDLHVLPMLFFLFLLCFLDRTNVGNARIQGMEKDINIQGDQFNFGLTIFYLAYILVELPSNMILRVVGGKIYLPLLVVGFGFVSMCTAFIKGYGGFLACRVFLGLVEGGVLPGISYFLTTFYTRTELSFRLAIIVMGAAGAGAFGGLLAAGFSHIPRWGLNSCPIHTWRNIFFFEGILSMLAGFLAMAILPNAPATSRFLSESDRKISQKRVNLEFEAQQRHRIGLNDIRQAVFNLNSATTALLFLLINITVQSFSLFLPTILRELGWASTHAQLMSVPPFVVGCIWAIGVGWLSDRVEKRGVFVVSGSLLALVGYALLLAYPDSANIRYGAVFLACAGSFSIGPTTITWGLNNARGQNVRAVTSALIVGVGNIGAIIATWSYLPGDAPAFPIGSAINLGAMALTGGLAAALWFFLRRQNRKMEASNAEISAGDQPMRLLE